MADDDALRDPRTLPHYILATLAGEQPDDRIDLDLHARNRALWNRWATQHLDDATLQALIDAGRIPAADVADRSLAPVETAAKAHGLDPLPSTTALIDFSNTRWVGRAVFRGFYFPSRVDFQSAAFKRVADFESATVEGYAAFESATFEGYADFESAMVEGYAAFQSATVEGYAGFQRATFKRYADFQRATFKRSADFQSATFEGFAGFQRATFKRYADFQRATFKRSADFQSATFEGFAAFQSAVFQAACSLINAAFKGPARFDDARFMTRPPNVSNATLHEDTQFHDVDWPTTPRQRPKETEDESDPQYHADCYSHLKRKMEALKRHEAELFFFAKELEALRHCPPRGRAWLIALYGAVSDYGRSLWRPLYTGFLVWFACALSYSILEPSRWDEHKAMGFSAASLAGVLGARRELFAPEVLRDAEWPVQLLSTGQSILGAVLIFLIGLALRNRFRIR